MRVFVLIAAACAVGAFPAHGGAERSACPSAQVASGSPSNVQSLLEVVSRVVPRIYSSMTNQAGGGAWRPYRVREVISLAAGYPASGDRNRLFRVATARCGMRTAAAAWVVLLSFPNAQTIPASTSSAYFVQTRGRWRFWFRTPLAEP